MSVGNLLVSQDPKSAVLYFQKLKWHLHVDRYIHRYGAVLLKRQLFYHKQLSSLVKTSLCFQRTALWKRNILDHGAVYSH